MGKLAEDPGAPPWRVPLTPPWAAALVARIAADPNDATPDRLKAALLAAATEGKARDDARDVFLPHTTAAVLRVPAEWS